MKKLCVFFIAIAMVAAFTVPAMAADWSFYGSSRMATFWDTYDEDAGDDSGLTWALQGNSRIGANVKAGDISGQFEYGSGPNLRLLYGKWNFGAGTLILGQEYTPVNTFISNQVQGGDNDMLPWGGIYGGRNPAIELSIASFRVALLQPKGAALTAKGDVDITIPKIEAAYKFKTDKFWVEAVGGYNTFSVEKADVPDYDVTSYIVGVGGSVNLGPAYINANVFTGQNIGPYGMYTTGAAAPTIVGGSLKDVTSLGFLGVVGFKVSDMLTFEGGYGQVTHDSDATALQDDETAAMYVQAVISPAKGFIIVPEIGQIDYKDSTAGKPQGKQTYFGAKWQINF